MRSPTIFLNTPKRGAASEPRLTKGANPPFYLDMPAASLRALLARAIDYAGLFPPANLAIEPALRNHAEYVRLPDAWMLGAFILPVAEFDAAARHFSQFDREHALRISALGPRTDTPAAFLQALSAAKESIEAFSKACGSVASIEQLEMPLPAEPDAALFSEARSVLAHSNLTAFWEAPAKAAARAIALIAESNAADSRRKFGFKLRTGGVTAEAFPSSPDIAAALVAAAQQRVPIKFTAGLHHPVRLFHESVHTKMHGFLNVLGAGVLAAEHAWTEEQTAQMLEDEWPASFSFHEESFSWRDWKISTDRIVELRKLVTSLGSCSFDEPREDLRALKLL
ncbi:MAG TPA: hypothetical protein VF626_02890 [Chthoniobacterales bacterium]